jgi:hypothetical protein
MTKTESLWILMLLGVLALLNSCDRNPQHAGGGVETETLQGIVATVSGTPVPGARVYLYQALVSNPTDSTLSQEDGTFAFDLSQTPGQVWDVRSQNKTRDTISVYGGWVYAGVPKPISLIPQKGRTVRLNLKDSEGQLAHGQIQALFPPYATAYDSTGSVEWSNLPAGSLWFRVVSSARDTSLHLISATSPDITLDVTQNAILLDDFEAYTGRTRLGEILGGGWWWSVDDREDGGKSQVLPAGIEASQWSGVSAFHGHDGLGMGVSFQIEPATSGWGAVGFSLGRRSYDLTRMDSLVFWMRSDAVLRLEFVADTVRALEDYGNPSLSLSAQSKWTRVVVLPTGLLPVPGSKAARAGVVWSDCVSGISAIQFLAPRNAMLEVDDIWYYGNMD